MPEWIDETTIYEDQSQKITFLRSRTLGVWCYKYSLPKGKKERISSNQFETYFVGGASLSSILKKMGIK